MIGQNAAVSPEVGFAERLKAMERRIADLERAATQADEWATVTDPPVLGANWSLVSFDAYASSKWTQFRIVVERSSTLTVPDTTGDVTNETVATLPAACQGLVGFGVPVGAASVGRGVFGTYTPSTGLLRLNAFASTADVTVGEQFSFGGLVRITP